MIKVAIENQYEVPYALLIGAKITTLDDPEDQRKVIMHCFNTNAPAPICF